MGRIRSRENLIEIMEALFLRAIRHDGTGIFLETGYLSHDVLDRRA